MTALRIGDEPLTPAAVVAASRGGALDVELTAAARERIARARAVAETAADREPIYGRNTGVGANRHVAIAESDRRAHSVRLLRSHAGGVGDALPDEIVRGTLLVRLAQMAAGGGGHRAEIAEALAAILRDGPLPVLRDLGGIGTGDLTLLAQLGLALAGEGEWAQRTAAAPPGIEIEAGDALALMSSNAATHAAAALAWADARELLDAGLGVAALTFRALDGNREAFAAQIAAARPLPGLVAVSERLRVLTAGAPAPARVQDPFGLRCLPPVAGALHDAAAGDPRRARGRDQRGRGEPADRRRRGAAPRRLPRGAVRARARHAAARARAVREHVRGAPRAPDGARPERAGAVPVLDAPGSSGVLIAEYLAADALARLRADAVPVVLGTVAISRGLEEHASFAWQAAGAARHAVLHLRTVLALEWVVAERALRMKGVPDGGVLGPLRALAPASTRGSRTGRSERTPSSCAARRARARRPRRAPREGDGAPAPSLPASSRCASLHGGCAVGYGSRDGRRWRHQPAARPADARGARRRRRRR